MLKSAGISLALLPLLVASPTVVNAQLRFTTNSGAITITGYDGPVVELIVPGTINGLPVVRIGNGAFYAGYVFRDGIRRVVLPDSVTDIGQNAFTQCTGITNVILGNSLTNIADFAFYNCTSLAQITIPDTVVNIGADAFAYNSKLASAAIPNGTVNVGGFAFYRCTSLTNVSIGSGVTSVGLLAFAECPSLMAITVDLLNPAFSSLAGVLFDKEQATLIQYPGGKPGSYSTPAHTVNIGDYAFYRSVGLSEIAISGVVTNIGNYAFQACTNLAGVTLGGGVMRIGSHAFSSCVELTTLTIPDSVILIGVSAFESCTNLVNVTIGDGVVGLLATMFNFCGGLTNVSIGNGVTNLENYVFGHCSNLTALRIPSSVINVQGSAFYHAENLRSVFFEGSAPLNTGGDAFLGNDIATVYYLPGTTGWGATFGGRPTAVWKPEIADGAGVETNQFGFNILWASGMTVVVEASPDATDAIWTPLTTNFLSEDTLYFVDPEWTNYGSRFYRLRWP